MALVRPDEPTTRQLSGIKISFNAWYNAGKVHFKGEVPCWGRSVRPPEGRRSRERASSIVYSPFSCRSMLLTVSKKDSWNRRTEGRTSLCLCFSPSYSSSELSWSPYGSMTYGSHPRDEDTNRNGTTPMITSKDGSAETPLHPTREHHPFIYPRWPTSTPGPGTTLPPPGQKPLSTRTDQMVYTCYDQERGTPCVRPPTEMVRENQAGTPLADISLHTVDL